MINYYCSTCNSDIEHKLVDKNTNKCLICKQNLDRAYEELGSYADIEIKKHLNNLRNRYNDSYVKHEYSIYWSKEGNVPVFEPTIIEENEKVEYLSSDVRPVFPEEQLLLQILLKDEYKILNRSVWYTAGRQYIVDGVKLNISRSDFLNNDTSEISNEYNNRINEIDYERYNKIINEFILLNKNWYEKIKMKQ